MKTGAVNAGVLGAVSGVVAGVFDGYAVEGAVIGAAARATQDQSYVLRRCLAGKGYDVLDLRT